MKFFALDPEVAGGLGSDSKLDTSVHPPRVLRLHYEIDAWLGDDLVQTFPCYLVTRRLWEMLGRLKATGASIQAAKVTVSDDFKEMNPGKAVPEFLWLKVTGEAGKEDLGLTKDARLVVSEPVLEAMRDRLKHCDVAAYG